MIDKIGRKDIVDKICYLIDNLPEDQNFCLALNGAWGSGKSVVVELLKDSLSQHPEYIIVHYDAWKNNFYSDPLIAMLYCILDTLENAAAEEVSESITSKRERKAVSKMIVEVGGAVVDALSERNKVIGFIKSAIDKIRTVIKAYKETALTNNPEVEEYKSYASFLNQTINQLNEITGQTLIKDKQTRLVVLVDEIDRCLPNEQLVILERLHHLFNVKNCAVIVALNKDAIHKNFEKNYGGNSEDYLRKFFQYNFELPINAVALLKNRLIDVFYDINDKREKAIIEKGVNFIIDDMEKVASGMIQDGVNAIKLDNRDIEKYISDASNILKSIVNYHPALLWFTLRMLFYWLFKKDLYKRIVEEKYYNAVFISELSSYYGIKNEQPSRISIYVNYKGGAQYVDYYIYSNKSYNDLLFLFNFCRYRDNQFMLKQFVNVVENISFEKPNISEVIAQIKTVLSEMERYGNL